jgi:hypothetical protein
MSAATAWLLGEFTAAEKAKTADWLTALGASP